MDGGGADRDRTDDLVIANDALSQLSYGPTTGGLWEESCILSSVAPQAWCTFAERRVGYNLYASHKSRKLVCKWVRTVCLKKHESPDVGERAMEEVITRRHTYAHYLGPKWRPLRGSFLSPRCRSTTRRSSAGPFRQCGTAAPDIMQGDILATNVRAIRAEGHWLGEGHTADGNRAVAISKTNDGT